MILINHLKLITDWYPCKINNPTSNKQQTTNNKQTNKQQTNKQQT